MPEKIEISEEKRNELITKFRIFLEKKYKKELVKAANEGKPLVMDFSLLDKYSPELGDTLLSLPDEMYDIANEAVKGIQLEEGVKVRFSNLPDSVKIRDLRSKHIGKFLCTEGIVRKASEIRPEIIATLWECPECGDTIRQERRGIFVARPFQCNCGNRKDFKQIGKEMIDTRWIVVEEPFELTEGEKPSQVTIFLTEDLVSPDGRRITDPGNRIKINGVLREIPKGKAWSVKLDFYHDGNHVEPTEVGWERLEISREDEAEIKKLAKKPEIYEMFVDSIAPSLYGLRDIKESIVMQLFGGVPRDLKDGTHFRGDIHLLLIGDPASGKSQLLKLVPEIVPRGKYVSGKGVTGAGLCMAYDTLVPLAHGEIRQIGELVEDALKKGKRKIEGGWLSDSSYIEINCLDMKDYKIKKRRVSKFFKLKPNSKLVKFKMQSGREIKLTAENPVLVIRDGELAWEKASDIKPGELIATARRIPVNEEIVNVRPEFARFAGMVAGDGDIGNRELRFHNSSDFYLDEFSRLSSSLGFRPRKYYQSNRIPCIRVASKDLCNNLEAFGIPRGKKADKLCIPEKILKSNRLLSSFLSGLFVCDGSAVEKGKGSYIEFTTTSERLAKEVQTALLRFSVLSKMRKRKPSRKGFIGRKEKYIVIIRGQKNLKKFDRYIGFSGEKNEKLKRFIRRGLKPNTNIDVIPNIGKRLWLVRKGLCIPIKGREGLYFLRQYEYGRRNPSPEKLLEFLEKLEKVRRHSYFDFLKRLANSDIFWDKVVGKGRVNEEWVYDLTVEDEHNFVANDFIVHNTATVTKDEQFMGGWVLEAGAMVLANKGLLSVDEFEKMTPDDQIAMHEGMEQGSVSIAKASIVATLPAKTSVLAGGNPKFSRFDPYLPISKQITVPETLLSRFDLKFALRDVPDSETDKLIVDHVLKSREEDYEASRPKLEPAFIRKYVAYAKDNCKPTLPQETGKLLRNFYLRTRKKAEGANIPIPITLRQFEALMRLSEASAKMQLSPKVRKEDAQRAIKLMRASLRQLGFDPETGQIDVDRAEGAISTSERSKIRIVLDIINELSETKKEVLVEEIRERAKKEGVEEEIDEILEKLKREGMLFEPTPGYVQKV